jgi:hypothetical protein
MLVAFVSLQGSDSTVYVCAGIEKSFRSTHTFSIAAIAEVIA